MAHGARICAELLTICIQVLVQTAGSVRPSSTALSTWPAICSLCWGFSAEQSGPPSCGGRQMWLASGQAESRPSGWAGLLAQG